MINRLDINRLIIKIVTKTIGDSNIKNVNLYK